MGRLPSKSLFVGSLLVGTALLTGAVVAVVKRTTRQSESPAVATVDAPPPPKLAPPPSERGSARFGLTLPPGSDISSVSYAVISPDRVVIARGTIPATGDGRPLESASIILPAGQRDTVTFVGSSKGPAVRVSYLGTRTFEVEPGRTTKVDLPSATGGEGGAQLAALTGDTGDGKKTVSDPVLACQSCQLASQQPICNSPNITATSATDPNDGDQTGIGWGCSTLPDAKAQAACLALLRCLNANGCGRPGENPVSGCYCGGASPESCIGGVGITGACVAEYHAAAAASAGAPATGANAAALAQFIATAASDPTTAVGLADNVKHCAMETHCDACDML